MKRGKRSLAQHILYDYDAIGDIRSLTPPGRPAHTFNFTAVNRREDYIPPDVGAGSNKTHYDYNTDKQLDLITRPDGKKIDFVYDTTQGRLDKISIFEGTTEIGNTNITYYATNHPSAGHVSSITTSSNDLLSFTYDGLLLTSATWAGTIDGSIEHSYNNDFRFQSESVNRSNTVNFEYDDDGLLIQAGVLTLHHDVPAEPETKNGLLRGTTLSNITTSIEYNEFGELKDYTAVFNGPTNPVSLFESHYPVRDKLGRIKERVETILGQTKTFKYDYDPVGRMWKVYEDNNLVREYNYDANGNRLLYKADGSPDVEYDDQDRLKQYRNIVYTYTDNGELESKTDINGQTKYTYDVFGNLKHVELPNGTNIDYIIDGRGRRIGKKINGTLVRGFLYRDPLNQVIAEVDSTGNVMSRFVYGTRFNVPDYMVKNEVTYQIIADHTGSVRLVVDVVNGAVAQHLDYDEFGNVIMDTNPGFQPFGFAGGLYDEETGLVRFGQRDYNPSIGRWTAKDPILFAGFDQNLYVYVFNDPVNFADPFGLLGYAWGFGLDFSTINPSSGGGGTYGINLEYTSEYGWELYGYYTPLDMPSHGFEVGLALTANVAIGEGCWAGLFDTYTGSFGPVQGGFFHSPLEGPDLGYYGVQLGVTTPDIGIGGARVRYEPLNIIKFLTGHYL